MSSVRPKRNENCTVFGLTFTTQEQNRIPILHSVKILRLKPDVLTFLQVVFSIQDNSMHGCKMRFGIWMVVYLDQYMKIVNFHWLREI